MPLSPDQVQSLRALITNLDMKTAESGLELLGSLEPDEADLRAVFGHSEALSDFNGLRDAVFQLFGPNMNRVSSQQISSITMWALMALAQREVTWVKGLETLKVRGLLMKLPPNFAQLSRLERLDLSNTVIRTLPDTIGGLKNLKRLELKQTELRSLPDAIGDLEQLQYLGLNALGLEELPASIGKLHQLVELDLSGNCLTKLPLSFSQLTRLEVLDLGFHYESTYDLYCEDEYICNQLETLPESFGDLVQLRSLNLESNCLERLPESIDQLVKLKSLNLKNNALLSLPEGIGGLLNLEILNLNGNALTTLPDSMLRLKNLKALNLSGNKLKSRKIADKMRERSAENGFELIF